MAKLKGFIIYNNFDHLIFIIAYLLVNNLFTFRPLNIHCPLIAKFFTRCETIKFDKP